MYVVGSFSTARPAGAAPGQQTVSRKNILAYNLTTGALVTGFAPVLNAQALTVTSSPDGSRLYVGGDFTTVNGVSAQRIAALNPTTGARSRRSRPRPVGRCAPSRLPFHGLLRWELHLGQLGEPGEARCGPRQRRRVAPLGADRGLQGQCLGDLAIGRPGRRRWCLLDAQRFEPARIRTRRRQCQHRGVATVPRERRCPRRRSQRRDPGSGRRRPERVRGRLRDGSGGNFEGTFAANWSDGSIRWLEDCHGDKYGVFPSSKAVYTAGHAHYCGNLGGFPETSPRSWHRAIAFGKAATGVLTRDPLRVSQLHRYRRSLTAQLVPRHGHRHLHWAEPRPLGGDRQ